MISSNLRLVTEPRARFVNCLQRRTSFRGLWFVTLAVLPGCNRIPYELAPVHGTVTIDGQPFTDGKIMFAPMSGDGNLNPGKPAFGRLQPDGSFVLSTYQDNDGAIVGEHTVTLINTISTPTDEPPVPAKSGSPQRAFPRFSRARASGKYQVVSGRSNRFDINFSRKDVARYALHD